jgi:hypothetical protein
MGPCLSQSTPVSTWANNSVRKGATLAAGGKRREGIETWQALAPTSTSERKRTGLRVWSWLDGWSSQKERTLIIASLEVMGGGCPVVQELFLLQCLNSTKAYHSYAPDRVLAAQGSLGGEEKHAGDSTCSAQPPLAMDDNPSAVKKCGADGRLQFLPYLEEPVVGRGAIHNR